jgi:hypothetical protein
MISDHKKKQTCFPKNLASGDQKQNYSLLLFFPATYIVILRSNNKPAFPTICHLVTFCDQKQKYPAFFLPAT